MRIVLFLPSLIAVAASFDPELTDFITVTENNKQWFFDIFPATPNPTITLYRRSFYTFNIDAAGNPFYIKTTSSPGATDRYDNGISFNGASRGEIYVELPQEAPDLLYYVCSVHFNQSGIINVLTFNFPLTNTTIESSSSTGTTTDNLEVEEGLTTSGRIAYLVVLSVTGAGGVLLAIMWCWTEHCPVHHY